MRSPLHHSPILFQRPGPSTYRATSYLLPLQFPPFNTVVAIWYFYVPLVKCPAAHRQLFSYLFQSFRFSNTQYGTLQRYITTTIQPGRRRPTRPICHPILRPLLLGMFLLYFRQFTKTGVIQLGVRATLTSQYGPRRPLNVGHQTISFCGRSVSSRSGTPLPLFLR